MSRGCSRAPGPPCSPGMGPAHPLALLLATLSPPASPRKLIIILSPGMNFLCTGFLLSSHHLMGLPTGVTRDHKYPHGHCLLWANFWPTTLCVDSTASSCLRVYTARLVTLHAHCRLPSSTGLRSLTAAHYGHWWMPGGQRPGVAGKCPGQARQGSALHSYWTLY